MPDLIQGERVLMKRRMHWGVFILPSLGVLISIVFILIARIMFSQIADTFSRVAGVNHPVASPFGWMMWLILIPSMAPVLVALGAYLHSEIMVTDQRISYRTGFFIRVSGELPLSRLEASVVVESLLGRLFGYGTVVVKGTGGTTFALSYIADPKGFCDQLRQYSSPAQRPPVSPSKPSSPLLPDDSRYMPKG